MKRRVIIGLSVLAITVSALLLLTGWVSAWPAAQPPLIDAQSRYLSSGGGTPTEGGAPTILSYQGQVKVNGSPYDGTGYFKFAVVDSAGTTSYWSNDGTSTAGSEPASAVQLTVSGGLFNVLLGDTSVPGITSPLYRSVFSDYERYLRVWFSDDDATYQQLTPDRRVASVPYALQAQQAANSDTLDGLQPSDFWQLSGNFGTDPHTDFLGTRDAVSLTLGVSGTAAVRIDTAHNVGVGTDDPTERLTVRGNGLILGEDDPVARGYTSANLYRPQSVYVSGHYAYVASYRNDRLAIFDVSDPDNIVARGYTSSNLYGPSSVYVSGRYAYVTSWGYGLSIFDVSNPEDIVAKGHTSTNLAQPESVYVSGKYAYVASRLSPYLAIFDVSDPHNIVPRGYTSSYLNYRGSVYVSGKYAYVASEGADCLAIFHVSNPDNIVPWAYASTNLYFPSSVYVSGQYAYVASYGNNRLAIFDVSDTGGIVARGYTSANLYRPTCVYVSGRYAYVTSTGNGLSVFDVSNPDNIVARGYTSANLDGAQSVYVSGQYAYVASSWNDRLAIFELNHLDSPTLETGNLQSGCLDVTDNAIVGNNLYVQGGLNVGPGGALVAGELGVTGRVRLVNDGAGSGLDTDLLDGLEGAEYQQRVTSTCASGSAIRVVNADGTVQCQTVPGSPWEVSGLDLYVDGYNVGMGTANPQSTLQVVGNYIQLPTISGAAPPAADCDEASEYGRVVVRTDGTTNLYVCTDGGWVYY